MEYLVHLVGQGDHFPFIRPDHSGRYQELFPHDHLGVEVGNDRFQDLLDDADPNVVAIDELSMVSLPPFDVDLRDPEDVALPVHLEGDPFLVPVLVNEDLLAMEPVQKLPELSLGPVVIYGRGPEGDIRFSLDPDLLGEYVNSPSE